MPISDTDFQQLVSLIEDGELDDRMLDLRAAIDERNARRKDDILKLVKSVWGEEAAITTEPPLPNERPAPVPRAEYTPEPAGGGTWPEPIVSAGTGDGSGSTGAGFEPVRDPMAGNLGDDDPDIVSTGAQIG